MAHKFRNKGPPLPDPLPQRRKGNSNSRRVTKLRCHSTRILLSIRCAAFMELLLMRDVVRRFEAGRSQAKWLLQGVFHCANRVLESGFAVKSSQPGDQVFSFSIEHLNTTHRPGAELRFDGIALTLLLRFERTKFV